MKFMVGYNGSAASKHALALACDQAVLFDGLVFIVASSKGGRNDTGERVRAITGFLREAEGFAFDRRVQSQIVHLARGFSPGEDLVKFAEDNGVDHIFLGVEKISRTQKFLLGSTSQFVILKGPCPVTTTK